MKFEKFFLIDKRGESNRIVLQFLHASNGKPLNCNTAEVVKILQTQDIQMQTKFSKNNFVNKYGKRQYRNLRNIKKGDPINIFFLPVTYNEDSRKYELCTYEDKMQEIHQMSN